MLMEHLLPMTELSLLDHKESGGSGGMIYLDVTEIYVNGNLYANGGNGGRPMWSELGSTCFGGGGSGGRITIVTKSEISLNNFQVSGGHGIDGEGTNQSSEPGNDGTIYYFQEWISSPSHPNENHWYLDSSPIIQFNPQSQFHGCFYVFDQNPNTTANQSSQYTNENFVTLEELTEGEWFSRSFS